MPTAVVTGGAGFLGSHLCDYLLARDYRVICVDNLETGSLENIAHIGRGPEFEFRYHDVVDHIAVEEAVDVVYHLAAIASPIDYMRLPLHSLKTGSYGTHNSLGLAKYKRARFLLASTSEVYGDPLQAPQPETYWGNVNPVGPRGVYDEAKRYAEALTMAYHTQQGVNTCIARIFNSILADEQVLFDDGRELRRETVADVAARVAGRALAASFTSGLEPVSLASQGGEFSPALEYPLEGCSVPAFGPDGSVAAAHAVSLIAHPTEARCFEIRTRYGRSIRTTGDHSVFVEGVGGKPEPRIVDELEIGDRIAVARRIEVPERDRLRVDMFDVWESAEGHPWDLDVQEPGLGMRAWESRHGLFGLLVSQRRNAGPNWRNGAWTKLIRMRETDQVPLPVARYLGARLGECARVRIHGAGRRASLPASIELTDDLLWLLGLWVAEGSIYERGKTSLLTVSGGESLLARAEVIIRDCLGLHVVRAPRTDARAAAIFVHSKLLVRLMDHLGFDSNTKRIPGWILGLPRNRLKWFLEGYREGDGVHSGTKLGGKRHEFSTVHEELKDDLIVAFARFGLVASVGRHETALRSKGSDRAYPFWRLTLCNVSPWSPLEWDGGVHQSLNARCTADLVWAMVTVINEVDPTPLVYDFSVPGRENFWAGTGIMAHNTYGPRMRKKDGRASVTFIEQATAGNPLTVFGDGSQTRSLCYVDDTVRGLVMLAESGEHLPVNIGNPDHELTMLELAQTVIRVSGSTSEVTLEASPYDLTDDPQVRRPDITRARKVLGWQPEIDLEEGLRRWLTALGREPTRV